jgi:hypothetical protein
MTNQNEPDSNTTENGTPPKGHQESEHGRIIRAAGDESIERKVANPDTKK